MTNITHSFSQEVQRFVLCGGAETLWVQTLTECEAGFLKFDSTIK